MDEDSRKLLGMLIEALLLAAADAEVQISVLPPYVHTTDEIALTFENAYVLVQDYVVPKKVLPMDLLRELDRLDKLFDVMTADQTLWTLEQLRQSPRWEEVRTLAKAILDSIGVEPAVPDLSGTTYIPLGEDKG